MNGILVFTTRSVFVWVEWLNAGVIPHNIHTDHIAADIQTYFTSEVLFIFQVAS